MTQVLEFQLQLQSFQKTFFKKLPFKPGNGRTTSQRWAHWAFLTCVLICKALSHGRPAQASPAALLLKHLASFLHQPSPLTRTPKSDLSLTTCTCESQLPDYLRPECRILPHS